MSDPITPASHVPIYLQIVEHLRSKIAAGIYRPGETLPSLRALAIELKVNPNTVQKAYDELDRQGVIRSHRGVGMFVAERGTRSALVAAEAAARAAFEQSARAAQGSGLSLKRIRELFDAAIAGLPKSSGSRA